MNHEIKATWLDALRSGKYIQGPSYHGTSHLRSHDSVDQYSKEENEALDELAAALGNVNVRSGGWCCLGVLCDIVEPEAWTQDWTQDFKGFLWAHDGALGIPSQRFLDKVGLSPSSVEVLTGMNDGRQENSADFKVVPRNTFPEIAEWIDGNL